MQGTRRRSTSRPCARPRTATTQQPAPPSGGRGEDGGLPRRLQRGRPSGDQHRGRPIRNRRRPGRESCWSLDAELSRPRCRSSAPPRRQGVLGEEPVTVPFGRWSELELSPVEAVGPPEGFVVSMFLPLVHSYLGLLKSVQGPAAVVDAAVDYRSPARPTDLRWHGVANPSRREPLKPAVCAQVGVGALRNRRERSGRAVTQVGRCVSPGRVCPTPRRSRTFGYHCRARCR